MLPSVSVSLSLYYPTLLPESFSSSSWLMIGRETITSSTIYQNKTAICCIAICSLRRYFFLHKNDKENILVSLNTKAVAIVVIVVISSSRYHRHTRRILHTRKSSTSLPAVLQSRRSMRPGVLRQFWTVRLQRWCSPD